MEAIFLSRMIKAMEKTIPKSEESSSNSLSSMMFSSEMGSTMAKNGGIGLAKFIYNALKDKEVDLGEELSKLNNDSNLDKVQIMNLEKKVY
jgi:Rod binding domain-containing protein